jgi:hypothetical protein
LQPFWFWWRTKPDNAVGADHRRPQERRKLPFQDRIDGNVDHRAAVSLDEDFLKIWIASFFHGAPMTYQQHQWLVARKIKEKRAGTSIQRIVFPDELQTISREYLLLYCLVSTASKNHDKCQTDECNDNQSPFSTA